MEQSLSRLRLTRIDLWQLHRIDPKVPAEEQFAALREFKHEGLIRHVGLSEVSIAEIEQAREIVRQAQLPVYVIGLSSGNPYELTTEGKKIYRYADVLNLLAVTTGASIPACSSATASAPTYIRSSRLTLMRPLP